MMRVALVVGLAISLALGSAALTVALDSPAQPSQTWQTSQGHAELCALFGAIMDDNDSPVGLFARVARLYAEDHCSWPN